jgi:hypothetical protein
MSVARRHGSYDSGLAKLVRERLTYNLSWTSTSSAIFYLKWCQRFRPRFRVSGEPMFDRFSRLIGYRGIGVELTVNQ